MTTPQKESICGCNASVQLNLHFFSKTKLPLETHEFFPALVLQPTVASVRGAHAGALGRASMPTTTRRGAQQRSINDWLTDTLIPMMPATEEEVAESESEPEEEEEESQEDEDRSMSEEPVVLGDEVEVDFLQLGWFAGKVVKVTGSTSFAVQFLCDGST